MLEEIRGLVRPVGIAWNRRRSLRWHYPDQVQRVFLTRK